MWLQRRERGERADGWKGGWAGADSGSNRGEDRGRQGLSRSPGQRCWGLTWEIGEDTKLVSDSGEKTEPLLSRAWAPGPEQPHHGSLGATSPVPPQTGRG